MLPVVAIIGRPNVGKSTLFNCLTKSKAALVVDFPGVTRDRNYGFGKIGEQSYIVVDTAGIAKYTEQKTIIVNQINKSILEANIVLFVVDAQASITSDDLDIAKKLRKFNKKIILVINKIDGVNAELVAIDFFKLGFSKVVEISAKSNRGVSKLAELFINEFEPLSQTISSSYLKDTSAVNELLPIKVAFVGQPNAGKSTLINTILKEERVIVEDSPGTTRDSIYIHTNIDNQEYVLIDTAGVRRKARVKETIEKFSVIKTLQAIEDAEVVVLLIDAQKGIVEQDLKLIEIIITAGRAIVLAINKWDSPNKDGQNKLQKIIDRELVFINFIKPITISALYGSGIKKLFKEIKLVFKSATKAITTNKLSLLLEQAVAEHQPPLCNGRRIKLRYAHLGGHLPFRIIIHGNQVNRLPNSYKKYLSNFFREQLQLHGIIVNIELKRTDNPYV